MLQSDGTWKKVGTVDPKSVESLGVFPNPTIGSGLFPAPEHTPGPWWASSREVGTAPQMEVKICLAGGRDLAEARANARLIAQAPRMFDLLKEARRTLEMWKHVAPAVSLCADIDKAMAEVEGR